MRERSKTSADRDEDSLGSGRKNGPSTHPTRCKVHTTPTAVPLYWGWHCYQRQTGNTALTPLVSLPCKPTPSPLPPHHLVHCSRLLGLTAGYRGEPIRNREHKFCSAGQRKHPLPARIPNQPQSSFSPSGYHIHRVN